MNFLENNIKGQCFGKAELTNLSFVKAKIQGACFEGAKLSGSNFCQAKAGLRRYHIGFGIVVSLCLSMLSGLICLLTGYFLTGLLTNRSGDLPALSGVVITTIVIICIITMLWKDVAAALSLGIICIIISGATGVIIGFKTSGEIALAAILALGLAFTGIIGIAFVVAFITRVLNSFTGRIIPFLSLDCCIHWNINFSIH